MQMLIEEVSEKGLSSLLGKRVTLLCNNYIYNGKLIGINTDCVLLTDASIVYETGPWTASAYKDAQKLPDDLYVQLSFIESFLEGL